MPIYEFRCDTCGYVQEKCFPIAEKPDSIPCHPHCQGQAQFIISAPAVQIDTVQDVPWLSDFASKRKEARFGHKPIETRTEYKQYLKDNDLRPCSGENLGEV
jgi:putative FmdB family regulatory protein